MEVRATWAGADPAQVEHAVAVPLETALAPVEGVAQVDSRSVDGELELHLRFAPGTDPAGARSDVVNHLAAVPLPEGVVPAVTTPRAAALGVRLPAIARAIGAGATGDPLDLQALSGVVVSVRDGALVHLRDVARVEEGVRTPRCRVFGGPHPVVEGTLYGLCGEYPAAIRAAAKARLADAARGLPSGVRLGVWAPSDTLRLGVRPAGQHDATDLAPALVAAAQEDPAVDGVLVMVDARTGRTGLHARLSGPPATPPTSAEARALAQRLASRFPGVAVVPEDAPAGTARIFGPDLDTLDRLAASARDLVAGALHVLTAFVEGGREAPEVAVKPDRGHLGRLGLPAADLAVYVAVASGTRRCASLVEGGVQRDVVLRLGGEAADPRALASMPIVGSDGRVVAFGQVAEVHLEARRPVIARRDGQRVETVWVALDGTDAARALAGLREHLAGLSLPEGYRVEVAPPP